MPPPPPPGSKHNWRIKHALIVKEQEIYEPAYKQLVDARQALEQVERAHIKYDFQTVLHYSTELGKSINRLLKAIKSIHYTKRGKLKRDVNSLKSKLVSTCNKKLHYQNTEVHNLEIQGRIKCEEFLLMLNSINM